MDFPAYVPMAVRMAIAEEIEGNGGNYPGYASFLHQVEQSLSKIDQEIIQRIQRGKDDCVACTCPECGSEWHQIDEDISLLSLLQHRADVVKHRNRIANHLDLLRRLTHDERMQVAYALLTREFSDDAQWRRFVFASWGAENDYSEYRDRLKRAMSLRKEIAEAAINLARLLRQLRKTGVMLPPELMEDGIEPREFSRAPGESEVGLTLWIHAVLRSRDREPKPDLVKFLFTAAQAARTKLQNPFGQPIDAAISTRQASRKTEYLRAFWQALSDDSIITLKTGIKKAMAITATVVINEPNIDVSYDDVRKATAQQGGRSPESTRTTRRASAPDRRKTPSQKR